MRPWKPYESDPVLTPAMAQGPAAVSTAELDRLRIYLEAVAHDRPGPLHTAVAFNAAYFGFETGGEGYGNGAFDLNAFPVLTLDSEIPALPVGALVRIATGSDPLYAELVYKEGRGAVHDALGHTAEGSVTRPELLVPDLNAFGPGLALDEKQVKRLRSRGRWLGQDGHVTVDARYPSGWLFGLDDTAAFAQHLLSTQIDSLLDPLVPHSVVHLAGSRRPERLRAALGHLLATVAYVLNTSDYLRRVGPYTLTRERVAQGLAYDGPLCAADLAALAKTLGAGPIPSGRRRRHGSTVLTTMDTRIGPWLRDVHGAESLLTGVEYAVSVCRANLAMADFVSSEAEDSVLANGVRVELVDAFEDGGIWRSTYLGPRKAESSTPSADHEDLADRPEPSAPLEAPLDDDHRLGVPYDLRAIDSEVAWQAPLRLKHLIEGTLPLDPLVLEGLPRTGPGAHTVRLELHHPGGDAEPSEEVQETSVAPTGDSGLLSGIAWPIDFFPGLVLHVQWPRGGGVVRVSTIELETPVEIDGTLVAYRYDPRVLIREGAPGSGREGDHASGLSAQDIVLRTVRRCGHLTTDGHALLDRDFLPQAVYGAEARRSQYELLQLATDELVAQRRLYEADGSRDPYGVPHHPARPGWPRIRLIGYDPAPMPVPRSRPQGSQDTRRRPAVEYAVAGFIRKLPPGRKPTPGQQAAYRAHCQSFGKADGWQLPPGYTFVTGHSRRR
ncbi:hypothetical protein OHB04_08330 [Streptomyces sp. NBC_01775]|uniref:hypothetical protein n=1 Tax=Streptomyces sp. NBC_01775 TaxID=2975939 RepID=UPI002DDB3EEC|nr:hypothetical protein [Streptomyces sp. NBC_01775]WSB75793.1 hypothetical protein OHB04_08330 [Streptomyces sp. NBC_01775]